MQTKKELRFFDLVTPCQSSRGDSPDKYRENLRPQTPQTCTPLDCVTPRFRVTNLELPSNFYSRTLNLLNREARPLVFKELNSTIFLTYIIAIKVEVGA